MRFFKRFLDILGSLFMKLFNIVCSTVVLAMNIFVSFNHTWTLFMSGGLSGNLALAATIGCELAFIQSSVNMIVAGLRRRRPGTPVIFVWIVGTGLVIWSNVSAGWGYGIVGILLGLVPPTLMLGSKGIFSWEIMGKDEGIAKKEAPAQSMTTAQVETNPVEKMEWKNSQPIYQNEELTTIQTTTQNNQKTTTEVEPPTENLVESTIEKKVEPTTIEMVDQLPEKQLQTTAYETTNHPPIQMDEEQPQTTTSESVESMEFADEQPVLETEESPVLDGEETAKKMDEETISEMDEIHQENNHQNDQPTNNQNFGQSTNQIFDQTTTKISDENNHQVDEEFTSIEPSKKTTVKRKKQSTKKLKKTTSTEKMKKLAREWALDFYSQNGKLPGRKRIQDGTGCSDYIARQTLAELKEELKQSA